MASKPFIRNDLIHQISSLERILSQLGRRLRITLVLNHCALLIIKCSNPQSVEYTTMKVSNKFLRGMYTACGVCTHLESLDSLLCNCKMIESFNC